MTTPTAITSIRYRIRHETTYDYRRNVTLSQQILHMTPRSFAHQTVVSHQLVIDPDPPDWSRHVDYFGNVSQAFTLASPHRRLIIRADSVIELHARPDAAATHHSVSWEAQRDQLANPIDADLLAQVAFLYDSPHVVCSTDLRDYALPMFSSGRPLLDACQDLTEQIFRDFEFDPEATTISTPLVEVLEGRRGVCQDFAHLMIGCLRSLGLACRYVSGYILTTPPAGEEKLVGADASHAWVSVYCSGLGWIDYDPTNRCLVQDEHVTVGWGRDYGDVAPIRGLVLGGGGQKLKVGVTMERIVWG